MKKAILLFFVFLFSFPAMAETDRATLGIGESFLFEGINFTVINFSPITDSAVFCINNQKVIFVQDKLKKHNDAYIEVLGVSRNDVRFKVEIDKGKECGDECRNVKCFAECRIDADCDDGNVETADKCVAGKCRNNIIEGEITGEGILNGKDMKGDEENPAVDVGVTTIALVIIVILLVLVLFLRKR